MIETSEPALFQVFHCPYADGIKLLCHDIFLSAGQGKHPPPWSDLGYIGRLSYSLCLVHQRGVGLHRLSLHRSKEEYLVMSVERKVSTGKYFVAFILTIVVFAAGVVVGIILESARLADAEQITLEEKVNLRSLQLQQNYIESGIADCNALNQILEVNINELTRKMEIVNEYEQNAVFNEEKFQLQLRDYFLTEVQFLLVSQEIDQKCTKDNIKILYFY